MKPREIKKLIELVELSNINELEVSRWGKKVRIIKSPNRFSSVASSGTATVSSTPPIKSASDMISSPQSITEPERVVTEPEKPSLEIFEVKSPMVGTFYRAPAPDADPYVQVSDIVSPNQVLCIIEAMKLMNEIEAEVRGRIVEILVDNAQPVEYNQVLFKIEKL